VGFAILSKYSIVEKRTMFACHKRVASAFLGSDCWRVGVPCLHHQRFDDANVHCHAVRPGDLPSVLDPIQTGTGPLTDTHSKVLEQPLRKRIGRIEFADELLCRPS
jgi:hypothetical protein